MVKLDFPTDEEKAQWPPFDRVVKLEAPFVDARGEIQPLVDMVMRSAVMIRSNPGSVRANHYHRTGWHFCYVIEGKIEYYHRPAGSTDTAEKITVGKGEMVFTPPMIEHSMVFVTETTFLTLDRNSRKQEVYEADVVRVDALAEVAGLTTWKPGD
ncbi:MAG: cupin domain-containing protein [Hyphomicrobiales bacterium]|nr:cupin domain-containing protein [Hyphomicrobiales bacterium]MCP5370516.1 cupin domain-containing protein [Hyphomicrobiales bacterium]